MKKRILIVEDERIVAEDIAQCLESRDYTIVGIAKSGDIAIKLAEEHKPDLALMDIVIQGEMDGVDTALALKERFGLPVIFLTAYSQPKVIERAKLANPLGYIVKPFEESSLLSTVEIALHKCRMDRQMAESREWFYTTLKSIGDGVIATDEEGKIVFMNTAAEHLTGWDFLKCEGQPIAEIFAIHDAGNHEVVANPALQALATGERQMMPENTLLTTHSGEKIFVEDAGTPIRNPEGKIIGSVLVFRDVTDKKAKERQVQRYQNELERLVEARTGELRRRLDLEALISSICVDLTQLNPDGLDTGIQSALERVRESLGFADIQIVENQGRCIFRPAAEMANPATVKALAAFYWSGNSWFERELSDQGYVRMDSETPMPASLRQAWEPIAQIAGRTLLGLPLGPTHEPWAFLTFLCRDPHRCLEDDVRILQVLAEVINNVLQRRRGEEERLRLMETLNQAQKLEAIGKLSGGIAHDFNNMLVPIIGYSDVILQEGEGFKQRLEVMEIRKAAESAAALTRQLLAFSRKQILTKRDLSIGHVVASMRNMLQRLLGEDIKLSIQASADLWAVEADRGQLEQVIMNLCVNARDAMPKGGAIVIAVENFELKRVSLDRPSGKFVRLIVRDTGCGMPPEVRDHIFEPFYSTKGQDGTGLGLSVVLGIVEQHGGSIRVDSVLERGTSFTIDVPSAGLICPAEETAAQAPARKLYAHKGCERVLLVEDEPSVLAFVRHALSSVGFHVVTAASVQAALQVFHEHKGQFDMIFSDAVLPDGNGMELIEKLLGQNPRLRVLLSSGYTDSRGLLDRALARNMAFLHKPYSLAELYEKLRAVMSAPVSQEVRDALAIGL